MTKATMKKTIDVAAAFDFLASHARVLDWRRAELLFGQAGQQAVLAALDAYRNADGGYGWGLEPDLRAPGSQPITALHVFDMLRECAVAGADAVGSRAIELCVWLASISLDDGGLPFILPIPNPAGCAPWFATADATVSSLHGTAAVAGAAWRFARHDPVVASHAWLARATRYCLDKVAHAEELRAHELVFSLRLLDVIAQDDSEADRQLARLAATIPASGRLPVPGGVEGETLKPLDIAPAPNTPISRYLAGEIVEADLDRLAVGQQADGGWSVDFVSPSPAATIQWRGFATVEALTVLRAYGRLG